MSFKLSHSLQKKLDILNRFLDILFYIDFGLISLRILINASMLDPNYASILPAWPMELAFNALVNLTLILGAVNLVTRAKFTWATILAGASLCFAVVIRLTIGYWSMSYLSLSLAAAAYDRSGTAILRVSVVVTAVLTVLLYILSVNGFIGWIATDGKHAFGWNYSTDAAARVFYMFAALFVIRKGLPNVLHYVLLAAFILVNLLFMRAKTALVTSTILLVGTLVYQYLIFPKMKTRRRKKRTGMKTVLVPTGKALVLTPLVLAAPILAALSLYLTTHVSDNPAVFYNRYPMFDSFRSRLTLGAEALSRFGVTLFGQNVPQKGNGGFTLPSPGEYFYIDNSYIRILVMLGSVVFIFSLLLYSVLSLRAAAAGNIYLLCVLALIAFDGAIQQYFLNPGCNAFFLLIFTNSDLFRFRRSVTPDKSSV